MVVSKAYFPGEIKFDDLFYEPTTPVVEPDEPMKDKTTEFDDITNSSTQGQS